eukprot:365042-Chlamydomonas_euryale.AAC.42
MRLVQFVEARCPAMLTWHAAGKAHTNSDVPKQDRQSTVAALECTSTRCCLAHNCHQPHAITRASGAAWFRDKKRSPPGPTTSPAA